MSPHLILTCCIPTSEPLVRPLIKALLLVNDFLFSEHIITAGGNVRGPVKLKGFIHMGSWMCSWNHFHIMPPCLWFSSRLVFEESPQFFKIKCMYLMRNRGVFTSRTGFDFYAVMYNVAPWISADFIYVMSLTSSQVLSRVNCGRSLCNSHHFPKQTLFTYEDWLICRVLICSHHTHRHPVVCPPVGI